MAIALKFGTKVRNLPSFLPNRSLSQTLLKTNSLTSNIGNKHFSAQCGCSKNQTPKEAFEMLKSATDKKLKGTGLFLIPAPEKGILESKVVLVQDLTYEEAVKRGENCQALKWVPEQLKSFQALVKERAACAGWCGPNGSWCTTGCVCDEYSNHCH